MNRCTTRLLSVVLMFCRQLSDSSAGLRTALDVVVQYEERGAAMLTHMLGSTYSIQDLLGYALAAVGIAAMGLGKATKEARLPLMVLSALSVVAERAMMHSMHHLLEIDHTGQVGSHLYFLCAKCQACRCVMWQLTIFSCFACLKE